MAWLTAREALAALHVRPQTLYANVSRGRIAAKPDPRDPRRSLYNERDVRRAAGKRTRRKASTIAAETIGWGEPIMPSAVSTVAKGRLFYRGQDAVRVAETMTLEDVAALLWSADPDIFASIAAPQTHSRVRSMSPQQAAFIAMAAHAARAEPMHGRATHLLQREGVTIVGVLVDAVLGAGGAASRRPVHERIARAWAPRSSRATDAIRRALVLLADHELNASTFAVRVAASTGASLAASVLAGLAALSGPLHGGAAASLRALFERASERGAERALQEWLAEGRTVAGFGHPLYPNGDPRAVMLLDSSSGSRAVDALRAAAEKIVGEQPNVDFALAAMTMTFRLPAHAPFVLFATARSVGWIAHALEQSATGRLIRPRAQYVGPPLET